MFWRCRAFSSWFITGVTDYGSCVPSARQASVSMRALAFSAATQAGDLIGGALQCGSNPAPFGGPAAPSPAPSSALRGLWSLTWTWASSEQSLPILASKFLGFLCEKSRFYVIARSSNASSCSKFSCLNSGGINPWLGEFGPGAFGKLAYTWFPSTFPLPLPCFWLLSPDFLIFYLGKLVDNWSIPAPPNSTFLLFRFSCLLTAPVAPAPQWVALGLAGQQFLPTIIGIKCSPSLYSFLLYWPNAYSTFLLDIYRIEFGGCDTNCY